jgi:hypothetical protein
VGVVDDASGEASSGAGSAHADNAIRTVTNHVEAGKARGDAMGNLSCV